MNADQYRRWTAPLRSQSDAVHVVAMANNALTLAFYLMYPILVVFLAATASPRLVPCIVVPALSFVLVSVFRTVFDAPRPYESLDIEPLIRKDTKGKSFPSRHVFSTFVIALCWFSVSAPLGAALAVLGAAMAVVRVIGGVHFPRDVIAGALIGIACGLLVFLWP